MRRFLGVLIGAALHAGGASAADLAPAPETTVAVARAQAPAPATWPGFVVTMTPELAALVGPAPGDAAPDGPTPRVITDTAAAAACLAAPIAPRALNPATAKARDALIVRVRAAECRHRIPAGLLDALVLGESAYRPGAQSHSGAVGLTQLMAGTVSDMGVTDRRDSDANLNGGAMYLRQMIDRFGAVRLALAAYNAGPTTVTRAGGVPDNRETPGFVARVVGIWRAGTVASDASPVVLGKQP